MRRLSWGLVSFLFFLNKFSFFRTECQKEAWISSNVFGLARTIESFGVERYKQNIERVGSLRLHSGQLAHQAGT